VLVLDGVSILVGARQDEVLESLGQASRIPRESYSIPLSTNSLGTSIIELSGTVHARYYINASVK
jgi:hypothetical protein